MKAWKTAEHRTCRTYNSCTSTSTSVSTMQIGLVSERTAQCPTGRSARRCAGGRGSSKNAAAPDSRWASSRMADRGGRITAAVASGGGEGDPADRPAPEEPDASGTARSIPPSCVWTSLGGLSEEHAEFARATSRVAADVSNAASSRQNEREVRATRVKATPISPARVKRRRRAALWACPERAADQIGADPVAHRGHEDRRCQWCHEQRGEG